MMTKLALLGAPLACLLLTGIASAQAPEKAEPRVALRVDQPAMPSLENLSPTRWLTNLPPTRSFIGTFV